MSVQKVCIRNNRELCRAVSFLRIYKKTVGRVCEKDWKNALNPRQLVVSLLRRTGSGFRILKRKTKRPPFLAAVYAGVIVADEIMVGRRKSNCAVFPCKTIIYASTGSCTSVRRFNPASNGAALQFQTGL